VTRRRRLIVFLLATTAGCAGLVGSGTGGLLRANVLLSDSADADPVPLSEVDDERLQRVTQKAVTAYESNGTAELVTVRVPERKLDETREAYLRLTERPDKTHERLVTYRGYTVRIGMIIYT